MAFDISFGAGIGKSFLFLSRPQIKISEKASMKYSLLT